MKKTTRQTFFFNREHGVGTDVSVDVLPSQADAITINSIEDVFDFLIVVSCQQMEKFRITLCFFFEKILGCVNCVRSIFRIRFSRDFGIFFCSFRL